MIMRSTGGGEKAVKQPADGLVHLAHCVERIVICWSVPS